MTIKTMCTLRSFSHVAGIICALLLLCGQPAQARKEYVASIDADFVLATNVVVYEYEDEECRLVLSREYSRNNFDSFGKIQEYKYIVTTRIETCDDTLWICAELPEIGDWSVTSHNIGNCSKNTPPTFTLRCTRYSNNSTLLYDYKPRADMDTIHDPECGDHRINSWGFAIKGNFSSLENMCLIRHNQKILYSFRGKKASFKISLVKNVSNVEHRYREDFDDIFLVLIGHSKDAYYDSIMSYIVPKICFVKLEENSIQFDSEDAFDGISFTIIVQHPLSPDGKKWEYHRLKIVKEFGYTLHITINDLGPVPRSEWEPDWPDPATTPLWVEEPEE